MDPVPDEFVQRMIDLHGPAASQWIAQLRTLIESLEEQWNISVDSPFLPLSYNYVAPATRRDGTEAVLKLGLAGPELAREAECLSVFGGNGAALLLEADVDRGALLLERIRPGSDASALDDEQVVHSVVMIMGRLHRPLQTSFPFPSVQDWGEAFQRLRNLYDGGTGPLPPELFNMAETLYAELAGSMGEMVLLHGDLHHENILASGRQQWLAIDPQGVVGEPAYEVGAFLRNPIDALPRWPDLRRVMSRRAAMLSEAVQIDRDRLIGWGMAQAVLAGIWCFEDHGTGWEKWIVAAEALEGVQRSA